MNKDSNAGTLLVAVTLCFVCSLVVSGAASSLKDRQEFNKQLDIKRNILMAGNLIGPKASQEEILEAYKKVKVTVVDLNSGETLSDVDPEQYNQVEALSDKTKHTLIEGSKDFAKIKKRENWSKVFQILSDEGVVDQIIFPIRGKGLWSTLYGFLAVSPDLTTSKGLGFYQHAETPGLGGEVDNPSWKAQFRGKSLFNEQGEPALTVIKGKVNSSDPNSKYQVDGLSGATITAVGVANLLKYWLGQEGFGPYIFKVKAGGTQ